MNTLEKALRRLHVLQIAAAKKGVRMDVDWGYCSTYFVCGHIIRLGDKYPSEGNPESTYYSYNISVSAYFWESDDAVKERIEREINFIRNYINEL